MLHKIFQNLFYIKFFHYGRQYSQTKKVNEISHLHFVIGMTCHNVANFIQFFPFGQHNVRYCVQVTQTLLCKKETVKEISRLPFNKMKINVTEKCE